MTIICHRWQAEVKMLKLSSTCCLWLHGKWRKQKIKSAKHSPISLLNNSSRVDWRASTDQTTTDRQLQPAWGKKKKKAKQKHQAVFFPAVILLSVLKLPGEKLMFYLNSRSQLVRVRIEKNTFNCDVLLALCSSGSDEEVLSLLAPARSSRYSHQFLTRTAASHSAERPDGAPHWRPLVYKPHVIKS